MKNFTKEFVAFLKQGNMVEIAVGLLMATAFMNLVNSFTASFIMPLVNRLLGFTGGNDSFFEIAGMKFTYGAFISSLISFIIIGFVLFAIVKAYNRLIKTKEVEEAETEITLLKDIKDILEKQNK